MQSNFSHSNGMQIKNSLAKCVRCKKSKQKESNVLLFKTAKSYYLLFTGDVFATGWWENMVGGMGRENLFCHGTAHSKGVSILLNPNSYFNFDVVQSDNQGGILVSKLKIFEEAFVIVNIYAPTDYREQNEFIKNLSEFLLRKMDTLG